MKKLLLPHFAVVAMIGSLIFFNSCGVLNPNIMLHADRHYVYDTLGKDSTVGRELTISPNDIIEFRLFANDGFKMIDIISSSNSATTNALVRQGFEYTVDYQGNVMLPVIGYENLSGMTLREAEEHLEKRYSEFYVHPFVIIKVLNKRITIFPGEPGQAKVLTLSNTNTTLFEALASVGGISGNGKARAIKLIRPSIDPKKKPKIYKIDLSKIDGIADGNTVLQSGDIIYVEPRRQIAGKTLGQITPILSLFSSVLTIYFIVKRV